MAKPRVPFSKKDPARVSYDAKNDRYYRQEGVCRTKNGKLSPKKFYLGSDEILARERALNIRQLWQEAVAKGESQWPPEALEIANAVAKGQHHLVVVAPPERKTQQGGKQEWISRKKHLERYQNPVMPLVLSGSTPGPTLHEAVKQCAQYVLLDKQKMGKPTEYGGKLSEQVARLAASLADVQLDLFGLHELDSMAKYWKRRPNRKGTLKPIAPSTVKNQLTAIRYFVRWLHRNPDYNWNRPEGWEDVTRHSMDELLTDTEIAALADGIPTYGVSELSMIYKYATDYEKLFVLLGLNCGFAQSEITSLRLNEVFLEEEQPTIKRVRIKNRVYGRIALWPETVAGVRWQIRHVTPKQDGLIFISDQGRALTKQRIANEWNALIGRIKQDHQEFRYLSFKFLRKTAGQMVQDVAGDIVASVFLFHGTRMKADGLLDEYTNRDWNSVYRANSAVRKMLESMFAVCPEPFGRNKLKGGGNISLGTIERIRQLRDENVAPADIGSIVGVSRATVYRHLQRRDEEKG